MKNLSHEALMYATYMGPDERVRGVLRIPAGSTDRNWIAYNVASSWGVCFDRSANWGLKPKRPEFRLSREQVVMLALETDDAGRHFLLDEDNESKYLSLEDRETILRHIASQYTRQKIVNLGGFTVETTFTTLEDTF